MKLGTFASRLYTTYKRKYPVRDTGVTGNYDKVTQYSYKRMPGGQRRKWKKFSKQVNAVVQKSVGTRTVVFNDTLFREAGIGNQTWVATALYGFCGRDLGLSDKGFRDVYRICNNDSDVMNQNSDGGNPAKIQFKSGVIDLTMRNTGTNSLEVDLYEINVMTDATKESCFSDSVSAAELFTNNIPSATTQVTLSNRGVTLFDLPYLISTDRLKIYKKKKFFLPVGATATHQHRDPRNHAFNASEININDSPAESSYGRRKMTQLFVMVFKSVVGSDVDTPGQLTVGVTRKYAYSVVQSAKTFDSYNPGTGGP